MHFITCSCYRRLPFFASERRRDIFLKILREVRDRYGFALLGYVVMPEHIHLLISEPNVGAEHGDAGAETEAQLGALVFSRHDARFPEVTTGSRQSTQNPAHRSPNRRTVRPNSSYAQSWVVTKESGGSGGGIVASKTEKNAQRYAAQQKGVLTS